jgi:hypothetical protein
MFVLFSSHLPPFLDFSSPPYLLYSADLPSYTWEKDSKAWSSFCLIMEQNKSVQMDDFFDYWLLPLHFCCLGLLFCYYTIRFVTLSGLFGSRDLSFFSLPLHLFPSSSMQIRPPLSSGDISPFHLSFRPCPLPIHTHCHSCYIAFANAIIYSSMMFGLCCLNSCSTLLIYSGVALTVATAGSWTNQTIVSY